jgi:surfeit locus 1 family protein
MTGYEQDGAPSGAPSHIGKAGRGLAFATLCALVVLVALGTWQLQRLAWKRDLVARIAALQDAPAEPMDVVLRRQSEGLDVEFARVQGVCAELRPQVVYLYALHEGRPGWRPVVACRLNSGPHGSMLVDLGFQPGEAGAAPRPQAVTVKAGAPLVGVLRRPTPASWFERLAPREPSADRQRWFRRDIVGIGAALQAPNPAPVMLMLESPPGGPGLVRAPLPTDIPNRHLEYALTWYGLALALVAVYIAKLLRDRKA